jgi:Rap1a immunity proteins
MRGFMMLAVLMWTVPASGQQSIESLQALCSKKIIAVNWQGEKIGEKPNDYCRGFLEGAFTAMRHAKLICPDQEADGPFLLSVFTTYVADQKLKTSNAAAEAIAAAYQRAFSCQK